MAVLWLVSVLLLVFTCRRQEYGGGYHVYIFQWPLLAEQVSVRQLCWEFLCFYWCSQTAERCRGLSFFWTDRRVVKVACSFLCSADGRSCVQSVAVSCAMYCDIIAPVSSCCLGEQHNIDWAINFAVLTCQFGLVLSVCVLIGGCGSLRFLEPGQCRKIFCKFYMRKEEN